jgi:high-affinity iron transporter
MLRVIIKINSALVAAALALLWAAGPARAQGEGDLRRAVGLLDYVAGDYGRAVSPQGVVLSESEFEEQRGFVREAAREVRAATGAEGEPVAARLDRLAQLVDGKGAPQEVSREARALRDEIAQRFRVAILPVAPPQLARGAKLYAESCAACHGATGHPPPPEALALSTQPPAFAVPAEVAALSPQRAFSAVTYGVPKTAMPAFDDAYDDAARWDLAFYVLSLAHPAGDAGRGLALARAARLDTSYRALAAQTNGELADQLGQKGLAEADSAEVIAALRGGPFEAERADSSTFAQVRRDLHGALELSRRGDREGARRAVISAYLEHFEPGEPALRARDPGLTTEIEQSFLAVRQTLEARDADRDRAALAPASGGGGLPGGDPPAAGAGNPATGSSPQSAIDRLDALLEQAARTGTGTSGLVAFLASLAIALREGVEAALLVGLLLALLRKSDRGSETRAVHLGWGTALLVGALTWWASGALLHLTGTSRELTEGLLQLATAALLLWASHWVLAATHARKLVGLISTRTLSSGSTAVVFWLAFGAVYREMFEVVVFFRGLLFDTPGGGRFVLAGAAVGLLLLALLVFVFQGLGRKLKLRPLLLTCGILLCGLAVMMVGNGVHALQEADLVPVRVWGGFQLPSFGIYPTREGLLSQAAVLIGLVGSALWTLLREFEGPAVPSAGTPRRASPR